MTGRKSSIRRRSSARLAAVQALYQIDMSGAGVEAALRDQARRLEDNGSGFEGSREQDLDEALLADLVHGVGRRRQEIDALVGSTLSGGWTLDRLEVVLRAILRAGTYELLARPDIDAPVTINEYVDLAKAFFEGGEPKLVNGVLDRLAATLRPPDAGGPAGSGRDDQEDG